MWKRVATGLVMEAGIVELGFAAHMPDGIAVAVCPCSSMNTPKKGEDYVRYWYDRAGNWLRAKADVCGLFLAGRRCDARESAECGRILAELLA